MVLARTIAAIPWFHQPLPEKVQWQVIVTELFVLVDYQDRVRFFFYQQPGAWLELRIRSDLRPVTDKAWLTNARERREDDLQDGADEEIRVKWIAILLQKQLQEALPALQISLPVQEGAGVCFFSVTMEGEKEGWPE